MNGPYVWNWSMVKAVMKETDLLKWEGKVTGHPPVVTVTTKRAVSWEGELVGHPPRVSVGKKPGRKRKGQSTGPAKFYARNVEHDNVTKRRQQDCEFIKAMVAAIRKKLERPPRVGIDKTPCTKNPVFIPHGGKQAPPRDASKDELTW